MIPKQINTAAIRAAWLNRRNGVMVSSLFSKRLVIRLFYFYSTTVHHVGAAFSRDQ
jgi:hypothetical protein